MSRREQSEVGVQVKATLDKAVQSRPRRNLKSCGQGCALHMLRGSGAGARVQTHLQSPVLSSQLPSSGASMAGMMRGVQQVPGT